MQLHLTAENPSPFESIVRIKTFPCGRVIISGQLEGVECSAPAAHTDTAIREFKGIHNTDNYFTYTVWSTVPVFCVVTSQCKGYNVN